MAFVQEIVYILNFISLFDQLTSIGMSHHFLFICFKEVIFENTFLFTVQGTTSVCKSRHVGDFNFTLV